jgi:vesicle transport through interaction with t-SNAREs 1
VLRQEGENYNSKLIRQGEMMSDTTYKIKDGVRVMHETMEISHNIGDQLEDHTGRLINNRKKLGGIGDDLTKSGKVVRTMMNRIRKNKFILFSILGLIFLVIIIILGVHFSKQNTNP